MDIKKSPYDFICDFAEELYPKIGKYVFETLCLVPCSLIIDDLSYFSTTIRTNMNVFLLTNPGGAKSSLCKLFSQIAFFPLEGRSYTSAELEEQIKAHPIFSLIIEDYATMSMDERTNKIIEGILGDEKLLDRHTTKKDIRMDVEGVSLLCGVPYDLQSRLTTGTLSRTICIVKIHDEKEHSEIGGHIMKNIGVKTNHDRIYKEIKNYYLTLQKIQAGKNNTYPSIKSFEISKDIRNQLKDFWDLKTKEYRKFVSFNFFRELQEGVRILVAYNFLNYFNRERKKGILKVTQEDCDVALKLMERNLDTKYKLYRSEQLGKSIREANRLKKIMNDKDVPDMVKQLIPMYLKNRIKK